MSQHNNDPFGGFFDFNGDGKTTVDEEWIAYQIINDCEQEDQLPEDDDMLELEVEMLRDRINRTSRMTRTSLGAGQSDRRDKSGASDEQSMPDEQSVPVEQCSVTRSPKPFGELMAELFSLGFALVIIVAWNYAACVTCSEGETAAVLMFVISVVFGVWLAWEILKNMWDCIREYVERRT